MQNTKQVLVWRNDLKVRKGKLASQCCHASMAFLTKEMSSAYSAFSTFPIFCTKEFDLDNVVEIRHWLENSFRKIVCYVESEQELEEIHQKALDNGLISHMIEDNGATEFNGVKTKTCVAIGPHFCSKFEGLTDHLPLL